MISVAIITYNHEKYIKKALDSVVSQNYDKADLEIIIGDDGSSDSTVDIINDYAKKFPYIKVFAHANMGISKNIYSVLKLCRGDYVAILEGDDYWIDNDKLSKQLSYIIKSNCIGTFSNCFIVDQNNHITEGKLHKKWLTDRIIAKEDVQKYQTKLLLPSSLMFKNIFLDSGDKYSIIRDASKYGGCHSGMINLLGSLGNLYYSSECLSVWRKVTTGGSNYSSKKVRTIYECYDQLNKYYIYKDAFGMNYSKQIKVNYFECQYALNDELMEKCGKFYTIRFIIASFFHSLFHAIKRTKSKK